MFGGRLLSCHYVGTTVAQDASGPPAQKMERHSPDPPVPPTQAGSPIGYIAIVVLLLLLVVVLLVVVLIAYAFK